MTAPVLVPPPPVVTPQQVFEATLLGIGTDQTGARVFARCLEFPPSAIVAHTSTGTGDAQTKVEFIATNARLRDVLDIDGRLSGKGLWGHVDARLALATQQALDSAHLYFAVDARILSATRQLVAGPQVRLTAEARRLLEQGGPDAFYSACGTAFWGTERRGARYTLLYKHNRQETASRAELTAVLNAEYNGGTDTFGGSLSLRALNEERREGVDYTVDVLAEGVPLSTLNLRLADLKQDPERFFDENIVLIAEYLASSQEHGKVFELVPQDYTTLPEFGSIMAEHPSGPDTFFSDAAQRDRAMLDYFERYIDNSEAISRHEQLLRGAARRHPAPLYQFRGDVRAAETSLNNRIAQLRAYNSTIDDLARGCLASDGRPLVCGESISSLCPDLPPQDSYDEPEYDDLSALKDWTITKRYVPGWQQGFFLQFYGQHRDGRGVRFSQDQTVWVDPVTQQVSYLFAPEPGFTRDETLALSGHQALADLRYDGTLWRPNMCRGPQENVCNLRVVGSNDDLELTIFDPPGARRGTFRLFGVESTSDCPSTCEGVPQIRAQLPELPELTGGSFALGGRTVQVQKACGGAESGIRFRYTDRTIHMDNNQNYCSWRWTVLIDGQRCDSEVAEQHYHSFVYEGDAHTAQNYLQNIDLAGTCRSVGGAPIGPGPHIVQAELQMAQGPCRATMGAGGVLTAYEF